LQTERDKARLLDGMSSAAGAVDVDAVDAMISGLAKREFVLRRAGKDHPEVFTTRWAMSYLRGPMTRDQIAKVTAPVVPDPTRKVRVSSDATSAVRSDPVPTDLPASDVTAVMPEVAPGIAVRFVDAAAPWLADVGGDARGAVLDAAVVARVAVRYDEAKADLVHDEEFEAVIHPLTNPPEVATLATVDYDDRDLRTDAPAAASYRLPDARISTKAVFTGIERDLRDHLTRNLSLEIPVNAALKLYGRPGETADEFRSRCARTADERADAEIAALRDKYETRATKLRDQIDAAEDRAGVLAEEAKGKKTSEFFSTAGSLLGGLLGGKKSTSRMMGDLLDDAGTAARRRGTTSAADRRVEAAENKVQRLVDQYDELEAAVEQDVAAIAARWDTAAGSIEPMTIGLERTDVSVTQLVLAWLPVS
jgi:hypothetical protein